MKNIYIIFTLLLIPFGLSAQCAGVNPDCNILNDFECQTNYVGLAMVANPASGGINTSTNVGQHDDLADPFDAIIVDYFGPIDMTDFNFLKLKVYTNVAGSGDIIAKLEGGSSAPIELSSSVTVGAWTEYTFDFSSQSAANHERLIFILNAGSSSPGTYYLDDIRWTDNGTATDPCAGTAPVPFLLNDFECQKNETFESCFPIVDNPNVTGLKTSTKVGRYTDTAGEFDNIIIDYNAAIDLSSFHFLKLQVNATVAGPLLAKLEGGTSPAKEVTVSVAGTGMWEELTFDFSSEAAANHTNLVLFFNAGSAAGAGDVYFLDNIRFDNVLPVELTQFTGQQKDESIHLEWQTAMEMNSAGFSIEHSDGKNGWNNIGYVRAAGESYALTDYTFLHKSPISGKNQYRLRAEDFDDSFAYSAVTTVNIDQATNDLTVSPNPFSKDITFQINSNSDENAVLKVFDISGKIVSKSNLMLSKGEQSHILLLPENLQAGTYFRHLSK
ncbi:MAG: hypothetical protein ACI85O_001208 [Saprospiraceae bacterium]|jgi:hypothetical protein